MTYAPRRFEDDIYPPDEDYDDLEYMLEPDPDLQRDLQMEREWTEDALLDDPHPWGYGGKTGGYVDTYMERTYRGRGVRAGVE